MNCLHRIHLSIGIRQESHVVSLLVNTHTENSVLGKVDVFIVKHGFITFRVDVDAVLVDCVREGSPKDDIGDSKLALYHLLVSQLLIDRLEVVL